MPFDKSCMVMKAFIESQFNYCHLIWMFHSRSLNNKKFSFIISIISYWEVY